MHAAPFDTQLSGTTAVVCLVLGKTLVVGNCGDSRAILARVHPESPEDEVSDSFHWLLDFETSSADPEADWEEEECRRRQYDIVKQRRKFAITRSKSFAQPVSKLINPEDRAAAGRKKYSHQPIVQNNKVVRKKSLVFKSPEVESNERDGKEDARFKRIMTFNSLDEVLQVTLCNFT